jgi:YfiH family protein
MITVSSLNGITHVRHGFFTRHGGQSSGLYDSLNCGYGSHDAAHNVTANRAKAMRMMNAAEDSLITLHQVHSNRVITFTDLLQARGQAHEADALVTTVPHLTLGVLTADCAPVLFADRKAKVIGAAHAGWKGAFTGILENTVQAMLDLGATKNTIAVAIGPCIAQRSYEVGTEFKDRFLEKDLTYKQFFSASHRKENHYHFDLPGFIARRLSGIGITDVMPTPCDTCNEKQRFFSYRRATLLQEPDYGRQLSAICLEN